MNENIVTALIVSDEAITLLSVKPLDSTVIHIGYLRVVIFVPKEIDCSHEKMPEQSYYPEYADNCNTKI
jgi:hypothetical protein